MTDTAPQDPAPAPAPEPAPQAICFAIYQTSDGAIHQTGHCQSLDQCTSIVPPGYAIVECEPGVSGYTHRVLNGDVVAYDSAASMALMRGAPAEGYTWDPATGVWADSRTLDHAKAQAIARLLAARDALEFSPFVVAGLTYDADDQAQRRIAGAVQLAVMSGMASQPFSIDWTLADHSTVTLDGPAMMAVGIALGQSVQAAFERYRTAAAAVAAATTPAQADAIVM